ncbi:MAG: CADD family putative folate metabolism protein [candidate division Zixibacteria bacterium]
MATATLTYIDEIDGKIAGKSLLEHPFYQAWTKGELSIDSLRDYASQYYQHVKAFPTYLSAVHAQTENMETRREILKNLNDEEAGNPNHPGLWAKFGEGLGVSRDNMENVEIEPETSNLISVFRSACRDRGTVAGLAALYAYESQIPAVSETKIAGLQEFYDIDKPETLSYFSVHIEADKEHAAVERDLLTGYIDDGNIGDVMDSVDSVLEALYVMLNGVCHRHGIAC